MTFIGMVMRDAKKVFSIFCKISKSKNFIECHQDKTFKYYAEFVQKKYIQIISDITNDKPLSVYSQMGYYLHGFKLSVYFLYKYPDMAENNDKDLYYKIMCDICDKGGDTDTNCAIVGAMIGPLIGYKNFNQDLFEKFIEFIPYNRCQFTSAFMYVYVNYLEEKLLKNPNKNEGQNLVDTKKEENKNGEIKENNEEKKKIETKITADSNIQDENKKLQE